MKIATIIEKILAERPKLPNEERTADTVKIGDPEQECTGIAVTCCATVDVIRKTRELGYNFILCHEPLFSDMDENEEWVRNDPVYAGKKQLLEEAGIVVWRYHDHMHAPGGPGCEVHTERDYIFYGIMRELGWEPYVQGEETKPLLFTIPPTRVEDLAAKLVEAFGLTGCRIVGDRETIASKIFVCEHINGRPGDQRAIRKAAGADVMIPLEIVDWTLSEYVRDSSQLGRGKAIIEMGHFNTEELGMRYLLKWLPGIIGEEQPVTFVQSGDSFSYYLRG